MHFRPVSRFRAASVLGLVVSLALGCGSGSTSGGQGGAGAQAAGGSASGGNGAGGSGTGGHATGGGGGATGGKGGGSGGAATGGSGGHWGAGHGGAGGAGTGGQAGAAGGNPGRGGAGGANGGPCWSMNDCGYAPCLPPGSPLCGGACIAPQHPCTSDTDCQADAAAPTVCEVIPCSCPFGMGCVPGCTTSADCPEGQTCAANHHCRPSSCSPNGACPRDFSCGGDPAATCVRKPCQKDSECSGACVLGRCYAGPGMCRLPVP